MSRPLEGRRALVTGAGTGIGQGIARELAHQGASVAIHYAHNGEGARDVCIEITSAGGRGMVLPGDLARVADCRRVVDEAATDPGGRDVLVNNPGFTNFPDPLGPIDPDNTDLFAVKLR